MPKNSKPRASKVQNKNKVPSYRNTTVKKSDLQIDEDDLENSPLQSQGNKRKSVAINEEGHHGQEINSSAPAPRKYSGLLQTTNNILTETLNFQDELTSFPEYYTKKRKTEMSPTPTSADGEILNKENLDTKNGVSNGKDINADHADYLDNNMIPIPTKFKNFTLLQETEVNSGALCGSGSGAIVAAPIFSTPSPHVKMNNMNDKLPLSPLALNETADYKFDISNILNSSLNVEELMKGWPGFVHLDPITGSYLELAEYRKRHYDGDGHENIPIQDTIETPGEKSAMTGAVTKAKSNHALELPGFHGTYINSEDFFRSLHPSQMPINFFECPLCFRVFLEKLDAKFHIDKLCPKLFERDGIVDGSRGGSRTSDCSDRDHCQYIN